MSAEFTEIHLLGASVLLGFFHLFAAVAAATKQRGLAWNAGNRESPEAPLTGLACRLDQAFTNFKETFPLFAASILTVVAQGEGDWVTVMGAHIYFWARVAYLPVYAMGITHLRSLVWLISVAGILCTLVAAFT